MLQLAGIVGGGLWGNAQPHQNAGEHGVPLEDLFCHCPTGVGQGDIAVGIHQNVALLLEDAHRAADAGFGISHMLGNIDAADVGIGFGEDVDGFQVHFTGFLQSHRDTTFHNKNSIPQIQSFFNPHPSRLAPCHLPPGEGFGAVGKGRFYTCILEETMVKYYRNSARMAKSRVKIIAPVSGQGGKIL